MRDHWKLVVALIETGVGWFLLLCGVIRAIQSVPMLLYR